MFEAILKLPEGSKDQYEILKEMWTAMPNGSGDEILKKLVSQEDYKKIKELLSVYNKKNVDKFSFITFKRHH